MAGVLDLTPLLISSRKHRMCRWKMLAFVLGNGDTMVPLVRYSTVGGDYFPILSG